MLPPPTRGSAARCTMTGRFGITSPSKLYLRSTATPIFALGMAASMVSTLGSFEAGAEVGFGTGDGSVGGGASGPGEGEPAGVSVAGAEGSDAGAGGVAGAVS